MRSGTWFFAWFGVLWSLKSCLGASEACIRDFAIESNRTKNRSQAKQSIKDNHVNEF